MRALVQRVSQARVTVDGAETGTISQGLLVLVGVTHGDDEATAHRMADKLVGLRVLEDADGRMNHSCLDVGGELLVVSQFTLYGDVRRGRRPSFVDAAPPEDAEPLVEAVAGRARASGVRVATGVFGARMEVSLTNDGPVTLLVEL